MAAPLLEIRELTMRFGGLLALEAVTLEVGLGRTVGLIGPNGAGKTTLFNCITGLLRPASGQMRFGRQQREPLAGLAPHEIVQRGITRTFQNIRLFSGMTVLEHVLIGTYVRTHSGLWSAALRTAEAQREERWAMDRAMQLLAFVGLDGRAGEMAVALPFGLQRRLEIARALASAPSLLLLDEPAAGLNPVEKQDLIRLIQALQRQELTVLLIEHDMQVVMPVSDRVAVLDYGRKIAEGSPEAVQRDPGVIAAYLGAPAAC